MGPDSGEIFQSNEHLKLPERGPPGPQGPVFRKQRADKPVRAPQAYGTSSASTGAMPGILFVAAPKRAAWLDAVTNDPLRPGRILPSDDLGQQALVAGRVAAFTPLPAVMASGALDHS
jgi:hypothetical protein